MKKVKYILYASTISLLVSGCGSLGTPYQFRGRGIIYTHTVYPLTGHHQPVDVTPSNKARGDRKEIQIQYVSVTWDRNAVGEIAKKAGMKTIHYADLERRSFLLGIWSSYIVHVHGTADEPFDSAAVPISPVIHKMK